MENTAIDEFMMNVVEDYTGDFDNLEHTECDIVEFRLGNRNRDSLSENYILEIDAWARQALASNGFGDY